MNIEHLLGLTVLLTALLLIIQRTESRKRLIVAGTMIIVFVLVRNWIVYRHAEKEGWMALGIALFLNLLFWILIGRYNPVKSSNEIKVLGLDD